jgi:hypothetical protein
MWYDVGTISVTNGSTTVTGSGTDFISGVQVGEGLYIGGDLYEIAVVNSSTQLTLADAYLGSTATGQDYKIIPTQSLVADLSSGVADLISDFADVRDYAGSGKFDDGTVTQPAITFTQDQNNGLYRIGSDNWGLVAGGIKQIDISTTDVELNYSGSKKLATTNTGVDVTGTVTTDGLTVDGNVGIGTASPVSTLTTVGDITISSDGNLNAANAEIGTLNFYNTDSSGSGPNNSAFIRALTNTSTGAGGKLIFATSNGTGIEGADAIERIRIEPNGDVHFYEDTGTTAKMTWSSSAESLGIGTSSLTNNVSIREMHIDSPIVNGVSRIRLSSSSENQEATISMNGYLDANSLVFGLGGGGDGSATERMRIDSSGNLLVGMTTPSNTSAGMYVRPSSSSGFIADGTAALTLGRLNSDGTIANFLKDGLPVGSIGSIAGQYLYVGTGDTGLAFDDDANKVVPWHTTTNANNSGTIDLGGSTQKFKDLYLSGDIKQAGINRQVTSVSAANNVEYTFDFDVVSTGNGATIKVYCAYNHYAGLSYGAWRESILSYRSNTQLYAADIIEHNTTHAGGWTFSMPDSTTLRVTKTAGTYSGVGLGQIIVESII